MKWSISGEIATPISLSPPSCSTSAIYPPATPFPAKDVIVSLPGGLSSMDTAFDTSQVSVVFEPIPGTVEQFRVSIKPTNSVRSGALNLDVIIKATGDNDHSEYSVPLAVSGRVLANVSSEPHQVYLGPVPMGEPASETIEFLESN